MTMPWQCFICGTHLVCQHREPELVEWARAQPQVHVIPGIDEVKREAIRERRRDLQVRRILASMKAQEAA